MLRMDGNIKEYLSGKNLIYVGILVLYSLAAIFPVCYDIMKRSTSMSWLMKIIFATGSILLTVLVCLLSVHVVCNLHIPVRYRERAGRDWIFFGIFSLVSFGVFILWYVGYCPGFFSVDSQIQLDQAVSGVYHDKHPVLHTFLTFTIPLKLTKGWFGSIVLLQILFFSLVIGYMGMVMRSYAGWKAALLSTLFIVFNPVTGKMCLYPWKDVSFAIWSLLLMTFAARICFSNGGWLNKTSHILILGAVMALETIIRHNGILFVLPLLAGVLLYADKKRKIQILLVVLLVTAGIRGPVYAALGVENAKKEQVEILGVPLTILGNVVVEDPEVLDEETKEFVYKIAEQEVWDTYYTRGSFNSVKRREGTDLTVIEQTDILSVFRMTLKSICAAPVSSIEAAVALTKVVYALDESSCFYHLGIDLDNYRVPYRGNWNISSCLEYYYEGVNHSVFKYVFCYIGVMNLVMVCCIIGKTFMGARKDWKRLLLCISPLAYNFGTMMFLMGRDDRFFFLSFIVCPWVLVLMLGKQMSELIPDGNLCRNLGNQSSVT